MIDDVFNPVLSLHGSQQHTLLLLELQQYLHTLGSFGQRSIVAGDGYVEKADMLCAYLAAHDGLTSAWRHYPDTFGAFTLSTIRNSNGADQCVIERGPHPND
jgi:hypothetical protein